MKTLKIYREEFFENPLEDDFTLGTLVYKRRNWRKMEGKHMQITNPHQWLLERLGLSDDYAERMDLSYPDLVERFRKEYIVLDVYIYEHSGASVRTTPFGCRWDSGQLGWMYVSKETLREEFGYKRVTQKRIDQAIKCMEYEVKLLDAYLQGDVFRFEVINEDGEVVGECGNFWSDDFIENGMVDCVPKEFRSQLEGNVVIEDE